VVGRAVDREVERDVHPVRRGGGHERVEVLHRAEVGVDRLVAPDVVVADRVRGAGVAGARGQRVVRALAVRDADGWIGGM
jgi:hypothetical protein